MNLIRRHLSRLQKHSIRNFVNFGTRAEGHVRIRLVRGARHDDDAGCDAGKKTVPARRRRLAARIMGASAAMALVFAGMAPAIRGAKILRAETEEDQVFQAEEEYSYNATIYIEKAGEYVNVRNVAGTKNSYVMAQLFRGTRVHISKYETLKGDPSGYDEWAEIYFRYNGEQVKGHIVAKNLVEDITSSAAFEKKIKDFPESYKPYLRQLHAKHPKWEFQILTPSADWETVMARETELGNSAVGPWVPDTWKSHEPGAYDPKTGEYKVIDSGGWVNAAREVVEYYVDPRNMLFNSQVFQFLDLGYDPDLQTIEAVKSILKNTFMETTPVDHDEQMVTHAEALMDAAQVSSISPVYLASKILQEVGVNGSDSVFGTGHNGQFVGYYNYYNIGAYAADGYDAVGRGLWFASQDDGENELYMRPWASRYNAILGGAMWQARNYYMIGQNSLYLMKFNVAPEDPSKVGYHQYMTNVQALENESYRMYKAYANLNRLGQKLVFKIPVFEGMPEEVSTLPATIGPNQYIQQLYCDMTGIEVPKTSLHAWSQKIMNDPLAAYQFAYEVAYLPQVLFEQLDDEAYITRVYNAIMDTKITKGRLEAYLKQFEEGLSRTDFVARLINSKGFKLRLFKYGISEQTFRRTSAQKAYDNDAKFILRLYDKAYKREAEYEGFEYWVLKFRNEKNTTYSELVEFFALSKEATDVAKNYGAYVKMLYRAIYDREADGDGYNYWKTLMDFGVSREEVLEGFLNSQEFENLCKSYGGKKGSYKSPKHAGLDMSMNVQGVSRFVMRMYDCVLARDYEYEGYSYWGRNICRHKFGGSDMAKKFIFSDEYLEKDSSNEQFVTMLYKAIMGREPELSGLVFWVEKLGSGEMTREKLLDNFIDSQEYSDICAEYGMEK